MRLEVEIFGTPLENWIGNSIWDYLLRFTNTMDRNWLSKGSNVGIPAERQKSRVGGKFTAWLLQEGGLFAGKLILKKEKWNKD